MLSCNTFIIRVAKKSSSFFSEKLVQKLTWQTNVDKVAIELIYFRKFYDNTS